MEENKDRMEENQGFIKNRTLQSVIFVNKNLVCSKLNLKK